MPVECRDMVTGNEYANGCKQELAWYIEPWAASIAGVNMGIIIFDIIDFVILHKLRRVINIYYDNFGEYYDWYLHLESPCEDVNPVFTQ